MVPDQLPQYVLDPEVESVESRRKKADTGLDLLLLKPKSLTGLDLFDHMVDKRNMSTDVVSPGQYLDVELTDTNRKRLSKAVEATKAKRRILQSSLVCNRKMKPAQRKLDGSGNIKNHSGLVNDEQALLKLKNKQELTDGLAKLEELHRKQALEKKRKALHDLETAAPKAKEKLGRKQAVGSLTKAEIIAILTVYFDTKPDNKLTKGSLVLELENCMAAKPTVLGVQLKPKAAPVAALPAVGNNTL